MKKRIIKLIILFIIIVAIIHIYKGSIQEHHVIYKVNSYEVTESFKKKPTDTYTIFIKKGNELYTFSLKENLKKQKEIIKSIKKIKEGTVECILPIYKKKTDNMIYCLNNKEQVSLDYLKDNEDFIKIKESLKKYKINYPTSSETKEKYKNMTIYHQNILDNQVYYIWNYKGIYIMDSKKHQYESFLDYDLYDDVIACTVKDRFVLLENNSVNGIKNIYYYDYKRKKVKVAKITKEISKDTYINGIHDNLIYITDRRLKKQYTLNILKEKLEEIDEDETVYITYQGGKKKELSKSDFFLNDQIFDDKVEENIYYFKEEDKIYKSYSKDHENKILLLELDNVKEWKIKNGEILLLREDTLYAYDDQKGLRKILENKELQYNYESIYQLGEI